MLEKEFKYYLDNQKELTKRYNNRFVVIKNNTVVGDYSTQLDAYKEAKENFELGTFLIQRVAEGDESYTQIFHSSVIILPSE
jgi:hypothetical protein